MVVGYFDPVTSANTRRLNALASGPRSLAVVILDPPNPLLTREARAELVAALTVVDQVTWGEVPGGVEAVREEADDLQRRRDLIRLVHAKQAAARA